jgi:hypothetical protein
VRKYKVWLDRSLSLFTATLVMAALYFLATERLIPALREEPVRVAVGEKLPGRLEFELLETAGVGRSSKIGVPARRPTLLLVFNSACPACYANLPAWGEVLGAASGAAALAVGLQPSRQAALAYAREHLTAAEPVAPEDPRGFVGTLGIEVVPFTALVDAGGIVRFVHHGRLDSTAVSTLVGALGALAGSSP